MNNAHTPGPWAVDPNTGEVVAPNAQGYVTVCDPTDGRRETGRQLPIDEREANARRIVQCVNAHDGLVEALRLIESHHEAGYFIKQIVRAAIAKATGSRQ